MAKPIDRERQDNEDMAFLNARPEFKRFLLRVIQRARIFSPTTDGSQDQCLLLEGGRQLGLEILSMAEAGQPASHPYFPAFTLMQVFREEAIQPTGADHERVSRADDHTDDADADDDDGLASDRV